MSDKLASRRIRSSSITTIVSTSLVLFMLGLLGLLLLNTRKISTHVKENIGFQIYLNDNAKEAEVEKLRKTLDVAEYIKSSEYVTKEEAAKRLQEDLGEDFIAFLGFNPLLPSINAHLKADYANADSLEWIKNELMQTQLVKEVVYNPNMINAVNQNLKTISLVIGGFTLLLMVIALALINNTIRLSIYSKRFLIKTMQLVGATHAFIGKPFLLNGIKQGIYSAIIAILLLTGLLFLAQQQIAELKALEDSDFILSLFGLVLLLGIIISTISTWLAVRKYLRLNADELYY